VIVCRICDKVDVEAEYVLAHLNSFFELENMRLWVI